MNGQGVCAQGWNSCIRHRRLLRRLCTSYDPKLLSKHLCLCEQRTGWLNANRLVARLQSRRNCEASAIDAQLLACFADYASHIRMQTDGCKHSRDHVRGLPSALGDLKKGEVKTPTAVERAVV